jgi:hypothetical protein
MTYNFDPDRWLETNQAALKARLNRGEIDDAGYALALVELERRHDEMATRLDGTYVIPSDRLDD